MSASAMLGWLRWVMVEKVAQQRVQPSNLIEDGLQGRFQAAFIAARQRIFRFQPHGRDGIANLMRETRRQPPDRCKPLGGGRPLPLVLEILVRSC